MTDADDDPEAPEAELPAAPTSRGRDQALWVGFFLVLGVIAMLAALFILTDAALFRGRYIVKTVVANAGGIRRGDPVQMRGVNIGRVQRFKMAKDQVEVSLELDGEYPVPRDSHVELKSGGLLGGTIAEIVPGDSDDSLDNGDTIPGQSVPGLFDAAERVADQVETVMAQVEKLMTDATVRNLSATAENAQVASRDVRRLIADVSTAVAEQRRQLNTLEASLQRSAQGLERVTTGPEVDRALARLDTLGERMDGITASLQRSSESVETLTALAARGEGTLGKVMTDEELYRRLNETVLNLNQATLNLNRLIEDIQKNPRKYLNLEIF
ncbi:MAG TPA: MlaD family protein [Vicinamibacteria bacterium]|nr:MlaD family protein [Vicinamibacteria bacterium]